MRTTKRKQNVFEKHVVEDKFKSRKVAIAPAVRQVVARGEIFIALLRHFAGDWGEVDQEDKDQNEASLLLGLRLCSAFDCSVGGKLLVVTEADRSVTTVSFSGDY